MRAAALWRLFEQVPQGQDHENRPGIGDLPLEVSAFCRVWLHVRGKVQLRTSLTSAPRRARKGLPPRYTRANTVPACEFTGAALILCASQTLLKGKRDLDQRFTRSEVERMTGATRRQLDYWARLGLVHPRARW